MSCFFASNTDSPIVKHNDLDYHRSVENVSQINKFNCIFPLIEHRRSLFHFVKLLSFNGLNVRKHKLCSRVKVLLS